MTTITIERATLDRLIDAWDSTVLPKSRDGMMQERMEDLRAALSAPERKPLTLDEIKSNPVISYFGVESGEKIVRAVEAFHGIKEAP